MPLQEELQMINENIEYISRKDLSELVGCDPKTLYRAMKKDKLITEMVGKIHKITKEEAWKWWQEYRSSGADSQKNLEVERFLCVNYNDENNSIEKIPLQAERLVASAKVSEVEHKQKKKAGKSGSLFYTQLVKFGYDRDDEGIFQYDQSQKVYCTNFSSIEFINTKIVDTAWVRVIKINDTVIELLLQDLLNAGSFNKKLLHSSFYRIKKPKVIFEDLLEIISLLNNNKFVTELFGFGSVHQKIFNLGNKVLLDGKLQEFQGTVWLGKNGYSLFEADMINISDDKMGLSKIWDYFYQLYGMQAVLIIGFSIATLFFQQYMQKRKHFPLLYILAPSGQGKGGLSELICRLFGLDQSLSYVNCAGNATNIGIESKSLLLNNLPLVLNELSEKQFNLIKSRYDGQGSVKYHDKNSNNILERSVNGSSIVTTVVNPHDKQVISRCIFIDLDCNEMKKLLFEEAREKSSGFSNFTLEVLKKISFKNLLDAVVAFGENIEAKGAGPRIVDNYSLMGGSFELFRNLVSEKIDIPSQHKVKAFIEREIHKTEEYLNPFIYFISELERLAEGRSAKNFLLQDDNFLYFNFNGIWNLIKEKYKQKYFPFLKASNIKTLLLKSDYMAAYGSDFKSADKSKLGIPVHSYNKKIDEVPRRCYVLRKDKLSGYYR